MPSTPPLAAARPSAMPCRRLACSGYTTPAICEPGDLPSAPCQWRVDRPAFAPSGALRSPVHGVADGILLCRCGNSRDTLGTRGSVCLRQRTRNPQPATRNPQPATRPTRAPHSIGAHCNISARPPRGMTRPSPSGGSAATARRSSIQRRNPAPTTVGAIDCSGAPSPALEWCGQFDPSNPMERPERARFADR